MGRTEFLNRSRSGHALVLVAIALFGLASTLALALDRGSLYVQHQRVQRVADEGAIAGATRLAQAETTDQVRAAVEQCAAQYPQTTFSEITIGESSVSVSARRLERTLFARVMGIDAITVTARTLAQLVPAGSLAGVAPFAIRDFDYKYRVSYTIWDDGATTLPNSTYGDVPAGYRSWLNCPCVYPMSCSDAGTESLDEWMMHGYSGIMHVNTWVLGSNSVHASTIAKVQPGQILKVAIYDDVQVKYANQAYYHIYKFAAFRVLRVHFTGQRTGIEGAFEQAFVPSAVDSTEDGGIHTIQLTR